MDVDVVSSAGTARGPLVGHFGAGPKSLEGRLDVRDVDMAPILNRAEWKTRVTGQADFTGRSARRRSISNSPVRTSRASAISAANVRAQGCTSPRLADGAGTGVLRFDASGAAYGATATTRATFRFATPSRPLSYRLEGTFRNLDMRRLPERLVDAEARDAGGRQLSRSRRSGRDWSGRGDA